MRKTKRFLATLLAGIMVVAMAGCGSKSGGNKEDVTSMKTKTEEIPMQTV